MFPKERWIEKIIDPLKEIASAEFQERGWVKGEIHPYCRFADTICRLFDDAYFEEFIDEFAQKLGFSKAVIGKLDTLRDALNDYVNEHGCYEDAENVISDPKWLKIRKMAKDALTALGIGNYLDPSKAIFKSSLLYAIDYIRDQSLQERVWMKERKPNKNPFQEFMNDFFKVAKAKMVIDNYKDYEITDAQSVLLKKFYEALYKYKETHEMEENLQKILDDPEWHRIQSLATDVIGVFQFKR